MSLELVRSEEFESPITLVRLIEIATEWGAPLEEIEVCENYEPGGSGTVCVDWWLER